MFRQWKQRRRFERLIHPHIEDLRRFAIKLERDKNNAEDLLQEALLLAMTRIDQLQHDGAARVWSSRILYRTFLNRCRRRKSDRSDPWNEQAERTVLPFPSPADRLADKQLGVRLEEALSRLPESQRQAIWLIDGQGFQFSEAAEILGVRPGTVASRVARGRASLRVDLCELARERGVIP
ncbi:MAG: RNA polymerase sigma-70 factor (ECF subfamily) [Myxococcota bacterium]|jgi:RNA polymerase sigma-70 factor (ECF subfamily)